MKITQVKACFYLLFGAAMVNSNHGDEVVGGNCTSHSDCTFDHGACLKFDQCHLGKCFCDVGYIVDETKKLCQKLKKVGELCGSRFVTCDEGDLCREGVCTPHKQQSGMFGNACSVNRDCRQEPNLICANNVCGCNNDSKIATYGAMFNVCVHPKVILDQKTNDTCAPDNFNLKETDTICSPGLFCAFCPEWDSDTYKCLSDRRARRFPRGDLYDNCTSTSDCDYDGAVCFRFDQCQLGMCGCEVGLWPSDVKRCDKPIRERSHLHTRNVRPFSNTSRLSSREEDLRHIAQHTKPNALDFKLLIWTKMYKTRAEIPESIPLTQIKRAREIGRIVVGTSITLGFLLGIPLMMMWGRHSKKSGDSIAKRRREWIRNLQRQKKKEQAAVASAKNGD